VSRSSIRSCSNVKASILAGVTGITGAEGSADLESRKATEASDVSMVRTRSKSETHVIQFPSSRSSFCIQNGSDDLSIGGMYVVAWRACSKRSVKSDIMRRTGWKEGRKDECSR
jgi:hypothetical protein